MGNLKGKFSDNLGQNIWRLFRFSAHSLQEKWNGTRLLSPEAEAEKVNAEGASRVAERLKA